MKQYNVDAFTDQLFHGNQAAICVMDAWPSEELMMSITRENNFSETAFAVREGSKYHLRWFTPGGEIDLCGHATLACAYVLFRFYIPEAQSVTFTTLSGDLVVTRRDDLLEMEFPAYQLKPVPVTDAMEEALGVRPQEAFMGRDLLCVLQNEAQVRSLTPDMDKVAKLDGLLCHVTAAADGSEVGNASETSSVGIRASSSATSPRVDCISRSFAPKLDVIEDPVCGSGHCHIAPYWAQRLGKRDIVAYQASQRGGTLYCRVEDEKVYMAGKAVLFSESELHV